MTKLFTLVAVLIGILFGGFAYGADLTSPQIITKAAVVAPSDPFQGFHFGGWIGYSKFTGDTTVDNGSYALSQGADCWYCNYKVGKALSGLPTGLNTDMDGWGVGIHADYMFNIPQTLVRGRFLLGPGVSLGWWGDHGSQIVGSEQVTRSKSFDFQYYGKLEYVPGSTFGVYGRAGGSVAKINTDVTAVMNGSSYASPLSGTDGSTKSGWFWAIGTDIKVAPNALVFIDFSKTYYKDSTLNLAGVVGNGYNCVGTSSANLSIPNRETSIKVGLSVALNGGSF